MIRISKELKRDSDTFVLRWVISTVILNRVKSLETYLWACLQGRFQRGLSRWTVHSGCGWIYPVGPGLLNRRKVKMPDECQFPCSLLPVPLGNKASQPTVAVATEPLATMPSLSESPSIMRRNIPFF